MQSIDPTTPQTNPQTPPSFPTHSPVHAALPGNEPHAPKFPDPTNPVMPQPGTQTQTEAPPVIKSESMGMGNGQLPPTQATPPTTPPPIRTPFGWKKIAAIAAVFVVILGSAAGYYLTQYTTQDVRQEAATGETPLAETGCASCAASCNNSPSCYVSCTDPSAPACNRHTKTFVCEGRRSDGCGAAHPPDVLRLDLSNDTGQMPDLANPINWCKTVQLDAYVEGGNPVSDARVAWIGNNGQVCVDFTSCNPDDLDWVCEPPESEPAQCIGMTGTLKSIGTVTSDTAVLDYKYTLSNPTAAIRIDPTINPRYAGNEGWLRYTQILPPFPTNGEVTGIVTFKELRDKFITTPNYLYKDIEKINTQGIMVVANVIQADNSFCDGGGKWVGGATPGQPCTNACVATVKLAPEPPITPPPAIICDSSCIYGASFDQCTTVNPLWSCQMVIDPDNQNVLSPRCRLTENPSSVTCEEAPPPVEIPAACVKVGGELRASNPLVIPNTATAKNARRTYNTTAKHGTIAAASVEYVINKVGGTKQPVIMGARDPILAPNPIVPGQTVTVPNPARTMSFGSWETALTAAYTNQEIQRDGISYYARVRDSVGDYCDSTGLWVGGPKAGTACTPQPLCSGSIKLAAITTSPSPSPSVSPSPSPSPSPSVSPSPSPSVSPSPSPSVSPSVTPSPSSSPTPTPTPAPGCNETCATNADCSNEQHICVDTSSGKRCRLESYINSETCTEPTASTQPELPQTLPETGPEDWLKWLRAGLVTLGIGTFLFLLL